MRSAAIRLSEVREKINQSALDGMPKEQLEALRKESISLEKEYRAEILHEEPADRVELRSLYDGIELRGYMDAAINGSIIEGRALELNQHLGLPASHGATFLPYAALLAPGDRLEVRADAITNPPASAGGRDQDAILQRVFGFFGFRLPWRGNEICGLHRAELHRVQCWRLSGRTRQMKRSKTLRLRH